MFISDVVVVSECTSSSVFLIFSSSFTCLKSNEILSHIREKSFLVLALIINGEERSRLVTYQCYMPHYNSEMSSFDISSLLVLCLLHFFYIGSNQRLQVEYSHRMFCQIVIPKVQLGHIHPSVSRRYIRF